MSLRFSPRLRTALATSFLVLGTALAGIGSNSVSADTNESASSINADAANRLALGGNHSCAILNNGSVKCWGSNTKGQLGIDSTTNVGDATGQAMPPAVVNLGAGRTAVAIAAGSQHTCAILDNGALKCWGDNSKGQLGYGGADATAKGDAAGEMAALGTVNLGTGITAKAVSAGGDVTCVIASDDSVKCWGNNSNGQAGQNSSANTWGYYMNSQPADSVDLGPVTGTKYTAKKIVVGATNVCVILNNDKVKCWGSGGLGANGLDNALSIGDSSLSEPGNTPPINLGTGRTAKSISIGSNAVCAILDNDTVKCWGSSVEAGQDVSYERPTFGISDGDGPSLATLTPVNLGSRKPISIAGGHERFCATFDDGSVKCWGNNSFKQNGYGTAVTTRGIGGGLSGTYTLMSALPYLDFGGSKVQFVTLGTVHSCAVMYDATVRCWGYNAAALGYGTATAVGTDTGTPLASAAALNLGDKVGTAVTTTTTTVAGGGSGSGSTASPVPLANGSLPNLATGASTFTVGGRNSSINISSSGGRIIASAGTFSVSLSAASGGQAVALGTGSALSMPQGSTVTVSGSGFKAKTTARLWILKGSKLLKAATVKSDGTVSMSAALLKSLSNGTYTIQIAGTGKDGAVRAVSFGVAIVGTETAGELPATGTRSTIPALLGSFMLLAGVLTVTRRRLESH